MDCVGILELLNRYIHLPVIDDNGHETLIPPGATLLSLIVTAAASQRRLSGLRRPSKAQSPNRLLFGDWGSGCSAHGSSHFRFTQWKRAYQSDPAKSIGKTVAVSAAATSDQASRWSRVPVLGAGQRIFDRQRGTKSTNMLQLADIILIQHILHFLRNPPKQKFLFRRLNKNFRLGDDF